MKCASDGDFSYSSFGKERSYTGVPLHSYLYIVSDAILPNVEIILYLLVTVNFSRPDLPLRGGRQYHWHVHRYKVLFSLFYSSNMTEL